MKNLKRVLSLALSGIMLVGMMAMSASAANAKDFTDASEIKNQEAVTTMVALNVINGKDNGSFDPAATVTRAEMAKMITIIMNGGEDPVLAINATPAYSDIGGHWAQKYIEYCSSNGIIAGRGDGTFAPDDTVTGTEAAKMALVVLGYDSNVFGFTGVDWAINVNSRANAPAARLYATMSTLDPTQPLSRDNAAQLLFNSLEAKTMSTSYDSMTSTGEVTLQYRQSDETLMETKFDAVKVEGVVIANEIVELGKDSGKAANRTEIRVTNYGTDAGEQNKFGANNGTVTVQATTDVDVLGRSVSVYVKNGSNSSRAELLGDVIVSEDNLVVIDHSGDSINDVLDDNDLDAANGIEVYKNYGTKVAAGDDTTAILADKATDVKAGVTKVLIDNNNDGDVEIVLLNTYVLGYVSRKTTKDDGSLTVTADKNYAKTDKADVVGFDDFELYDYVLASEFGGKLYLTAPETVTGEMEAYTSSSITVDGTKYNVSKAEVVTTGSYGLDKADGYNINTNIGNEATFYLDANGRVVAVGEVEAAASQYALSWGGASGNVIDNARIKLTLQDGTTGVYTIASNSTLKLKSNDGTKFTDESSAKNVVLAYSMTSSGQVRLSKPNNTKSTTDGTAAADFTKGKTLVALKGTGDTGSYPSTSSTVFFYVEMTTGDTPEVDSVSVYTGYANAPSVDEATAATVARNASNKVMAVAFTGAKAKGAEADHLFLYSFGSYYSDYTEGRVVLAGSDETETVRLDGTAYGTGDGNQPADALYIFSVNSDGYYELTPVTGKDYYKAETKVTSVSRDTIVTKDGEFIVNENTVVIDNIDNPGTPVALLNGSVLEGQTVEMIVDDGDALMIVITADVTEGDDDETPDNTDETIKAHEDGVFTITGTLDESISNQPVENLVFIKFTTTNTGSEEYTLTMTKDTVTYTEKATFAAAGAHFFVIDVKGTTSTGSFSDSADKFAAGEWTVSVTGSTSDTSNLLDGATVTVE